MEASHPWRIVPLPQVQRPQGNLTAVEGGGEVVPFDIARVFYLYDIPGGAARAGHAHHQLEELIVGVLGAFRVIVDDGTTRETVELNRGYTGLYVPPMVWRELVDFSAGAVCVVMASRPYEEADYIRDYDEYLRLTAKDA
jgi:uncharacterized RmlC-like cupin family protein